MTNEQLAAEFNILRGEMMQFKEDILEELNDSLTQSKDYIKNYLIDKLNRFLSEKGEEWEAFARNLVEKSK